MSRELTNVFDKFTCHDPTQNVVKKIFKNVSFVMDVKENHINI